MLRRTVLPSMFSLVICCVVSIFYIYSPINMFTCWFTVKALLKSPSTVLGFPISPWLYKMWRYVCAFILGLFNVPWWISHFRCEAAPFTSGHFYSIFHIVHQDRVCLISFQACVLLLAFNVCFPTWQVGLFSWHRDMVVISYIWQFLCVENSLCYFSALPEFFCFCFFLFSLSLLSLGSRISVRACTIFMLEEPALHPKGPEQGQFPGIWEQQGTGDRPLWEGQ